MGRRKKGSNKRGGKALPDAVSDDEGGVIGEEGVYDEVWRYKSRHNLQYKDQGEGWDPPPIVFGHQIKKKT